VTELAREALDWSRAELGRRFEAGGPIAPDELAGFGFRGISLGLPPLLERLSWKTFAKVFVTDGDAVRGFNLRIVQNSGQNVGQNGGDVSGPYRPRRRDARFGEMVARPEGERTLLDYAGPNPWWHPLGPMRDVLVRLDGETILGRLLIAVGPGRLPTPSYFTLERSIEVPAEATIDDADQYIDEI
jgi:hypothetical protein